jgi:hypothetical protein
LCHSLTAPPPPQGEQPPEEPPEDQNQDDESDNDDPEDDSDDDQEDDKRSSWLGQEKADCGQSQCFSVVFNQFSHKKSIKSTDPGQV